MKRAHQPPIQALPKNCSSRTLSAHGEEQRERDTSCSGDDVLLFAGLRVKGPMHELEGANF
jgi:hypothetical protein